MILVCPSCATRYIVPDEAIGVNGRQVRCAACKHSWFQDGIRLKPREAPASTPVASPPAAATPVGDAGLAADVAIAPERTPDIAAAPEPAHASFAASDTFERQESGSWFGEAPAEDEEGFDSDSPTRPRRNPARLWTYAAIAFFVVIAAAGSALYWIGPPEWAVRSGLLADAEDADLGFYLVRPAERRTLPNGAEYFAFSARIRNSGSSVLPVPPVEVQLRDKQDRLVFSWTTRADKTELKPGEEASISESRLDIPKNAENLSLAFVDSAR